VFEKRHRLPNPSACNAKIRAQRATPAMQKSSHFAPFPLPWRPAKLRSWPARHGSAAPSYEQSSSRAPAWRQRAPCSTAACRSSPPSTPASCAGENERRAGGIIDGARTWGRTGARPVDGEACPCPTGCRQMPRTPCMATPWRGCRRSSTTRKQEGKAKCNSNCISDRGAHRTAPDRSLFLSGSVHGPSCMLTWFVLYVYCSRLPPPWSNCFVPRSFRRFSLWARAASFRASLPRSPVRNVPRHVLARRRRLFFLAIVAGGELSNAQTQARLLPFFAMTNPTRPQSDTIGGFPALRPSEVAGGEVPPHSAGAYPGVFSSRGGDETA
jgi:hypothetical protein